MAKYVRLQDSLDRQLKEEKFKVAYLKAQAESEPFFEALKARRSLNLTQAEVAKKMGTSQSVVARLERNLCKGVLPSTNTLRRYARALGKELRIEFV